MIEKYLKMVVNKHGDFEGFVEGCCDMEIFAKCCDLGFYVIGDGILVRDKLEGEK